jgi:hypothetical protein
VEYLRALWRHWISTVSGGASVAVYLAQAVYHWWNHTEAGGSWAWLLIVSLGCLLVASYKAWRDKDAEIVPLRAEIDHLSKPAFTAETFRLAAERYGALDRVRRECIRQMLIGGDTTDRQMVEHLARNGFGQFGSALDGLTRDTNLVQRVLQDRQRAEHATGYTGLYAINPAFRAALERLVREDLTFAVR